MSRFLAFLTLLTFNQFASADSIRCSWLSNETLIFLDGQIPYPGNRIE